MSLTSKFLSLVLRHKPEIIGLTLDREGWVGVDTLLAATNSHGKPGDKALLDSIIADNNKQRFEYSPDGTKIRARQGHSVEVDLGYQPKAPPEILYHGTSTKTLPLIRERGLLKMSRHHVHLSADIQTARKVGGRHGRPAIIAVHTRYMRPADGFTFYETDNHVWLVEFVPPDTLYLDFPCFDCGEPCTDWYMVHDKLWNSVARDTEILHIKCLEKRLRRGLKTDDFTGAPCNRMAGHIPGGAP